MDLSIVTLTYGSRTEQLKLCIESVLANTKGVEFEYFLVDNASCFGSQNLMGKYSRLDNIHWVLKDKNIGVSARNFGMDLASGKFVAVIDDDVIVTSSNWFEEMVKYIKDDVFATGREGANFCGFDKGWFGPANKTSGEYCDFITGFHVLYRNLRGTEGEFKYRFDENLFSLRDESDIGLQAKSEGWRLMVSPSFCQHSSSRDYRLLKETQTKDDEYFFNKWKPIIESGKVRMEGV